MAGRCSYAHRAGRPPQVQNGCMVRSPVRLRVDANGPPYDRKCRANIGGNSSPRNQYLAPQGCFIDGVITALSCARTREPTSSATAGERKTSPPSREMRPPHCRGCSATPSPAGCGVSAALCLAHPPLSRDASVAPNGLLRRRMFEETADFVADGRSGQVRREPLAVQVRRTTCTDRPQNALDLLVGDERRNFGMDRGEQSFGGSGCEVAPTRAAFGRL